MMSSSIILELVTYPYYDDIDCLYHPWDEVMTNPMRIIAVIFGLHEWIVVVNMMPRVYDYHEQHQGMVYDANGLEHPHVRHIELNNVQRLLVPPQLLNGEAYDDHNHNS